MKFWPLRSPPQIAGDSTTLALTTTFQTPTLPNTVDGVQARYIMVTWESATGAPLNIGYEGTNFGPQLHFYGQPYVFDVSGCSSTFKFRLGAGTGTLHLTPLEND